MRSVTIELPEELAPSAERFTAEDWAELVRGHNRRRALDLLRSLPSCEDDAEAEREFRELSDES